MDRPIPYDSDRVEGPLGFHVDATADEFRDTGVQGGAVRHDCSAERFHGKAKQGRGAAGRVCCDDVRLVVEVFDVVG